MEAPQTRQLIAEAITHRRRLKLRYHAADRIFEPHTWGRDHGGQELVCGYQVRGGSSSGQGQGWKTLRVEDIASAELTAEHFHPRPEYQRDDPGFARIEAQL